MSERGNGARGGLSRRGYARHRGCHEKAVRKAIASGRITVEPDGTIDPQKADAQWVAMSDPARQRGAAPKRSAVAAARAGERAVPHAAIEAMRERRDLDGERPAGADAGCGPNFLKARTASEILKVETARLRLAKMKGDLVNRARAETLVFRLGRQERDAWINWPARVAALMASELGVEPGAMRKVLESYVRGHLEELADIRLDLG